MVELTKQVELLQKEIELEKTKREIFEGKLAQMEDWKIKRESMLKEIEEYYEEEKNFREQNK